MLTPPTRRHAVRCAALLLALALALASCSGGGDDAAAGPPLVGPLCDLLPQIGEPAGPDALAEMTVEEALTWIPVLTNVEAGARAAEMTEELATAEGITILAPSDDAVTAGLSQDTIDDLLLFRQDEMRTLLESHIIEGRLSLADLRATDSVTTLAGTTITIGEAGDMARFDDRSETVCAGYETVNATIHVIDGVLGELPEPPEQEGEPGVG